MEKRTITIRNYHVQDSEEMEKVKQFIILQIAQNDISFLNLHRLADLANDAYYKE